MILGGSLVYIVHVTHEQRNKSMMERSVWVFGGTDNTTYYKLEKGPHMGLDKKNVFFHRLNFHEPKNV